VVKQSPSGVDSRECIGWNEAKYIFTLLKIVSRIEYYAAWENWDIRCSSFDHTAFQIVERPSYLRSYPSYHISWDREKKAMREALSRLESLAEESCQPSLDLLEFLTDKVGLGILQMVQSSADFCCRGWFCSA
jgi:hypothetical protein